MPKLVRGISMRIGVGSTTGVATEAGSSSLWREAGSRHLERAKPYGLKSRALQRPLPFQEGGFSPVLPHYASSVTQTPRVSGAWCRPPGVEVRGGVRAAAA